MASTDERVSNADPISPVSNSRFSYVRHLASLTRPRQWIKNAAILLPVLFAPSVISVKVGERLTWALLAFMLASAFTYTMNDFVDRERDRSHPEKTKRPIAAGLISAPWAIGFALLTAGSLGVIVVTLYPVRSWWPVIVYLGINAAYNLRLKHIPPFDVFIIALGFTLRVMQGYVAADLPYSAFLLICVFMLCVQLSIGKRRYEILRVGARHRPALAKYTVQLLDHMLLITSTIALVAFILYLRFDLRDVGNEIMPLISVPCATLVIFRYQQIVLVEQEGADPVRVLARDRTIVGTAMAWIVLFAFFVVGNI